jgi:FkbM family methyltransferase
MIHFFDGGANIGQTFGDYIVHRPELLGAKVWCFEPSPRNLADLLVTTDGHSSLYDITVCPFALLDRQKTIEFYEKVGDPRGDSLNEKLWNRDIYLLENSRRKIMVAAVSASQFILDNTNTDDEIILKLDVEGSEYTILRDLMYCREALGRVKQILVEWHRTDRPEDDIGKIKEWFAAAGKPIGQWMF